MLLKDEEYAERYKRITDIKMQLEENPIKDGILSMNKRIAEIQTKKDQVGQLLVEAIKNKAEASILLDAKKGDHSRQLDGLLASDEEVKVQKTAELRKATANVKLKDLVTDLAYTELDAQKADVYHKCIQQIYSQLESANTNLSRQISIIEMGIQIGEVKKKS